MFKIKYYYNNEHVLRKRTIAITIQPKTKKIQKHSSVQFGINLTQEEIKVNSSVVDPQQHHFDELVGFE